MPDDYPDLLGAEHRFPRQAWDAEDPDQPVDERLALVALSARAAGLPVEVVLRAAPFVDPATARMHSTAIVREVRRGLGVAAQLIAEAPWAAAPGLVTVTAGDGGPPRVVPTPGWDGPDRDRIVRYLASASAVGLSDAPLDLRWLPLELAATNQPTADPPPPDPAAFMFMGYTRAPSGTRLWLYKHAASRAYLNLDAESCPWRYQPADGTYAPCDDPVAALAALHAPPGADRVADVGL